MKIMDPGHTYMLRNYSGVPDEPVIEHEQLLTFMHRIGTRYPGNQGEPYDGTNCQEILRALISRCKYLNNQIPCVETADIIGHLRHALILFEIRAAREHGHTITNQSDYIEWTKTCKICGHIICNHDKSDR